jgi:hypothetical protein
LKFQWEDAFPTWSCDFRRLSLHCEILGLHWSVVEDQNLVISWLLINYRHFGGCRPVWITSNCLPADTASCLKTFEVFGFSIDPLFYILSLQTHFYVCREYHEIWKNEKNHCILIKLEILFPQLRHGSLPFSVILSWNVIW